MVERIKKIPLLSIRFSILICFLIIYLTQVNGQLKDVLQWRSVFYNDTDFKYVTSNEAVTSANWRTLAFNDSGWNTGKGGIGYDDNDDNTIIPAVASVFLRTTFTVVDVSEIGAAILSMGYDDAFVAYLNGTEIARSAGLSDAFPAYSTFSSVSHEAATVNGGAPESFTIDEELVKQHILQGENVLAIQVHNTGLNSTDMSSNAWFTVGLKTTTQRYLPTPNWFAPPVSNELSSNLPIMIIETENGQSINDEPKTIAHMGLINNGAGKTNSSDDHYNEYDGTIGIELRGNSTQGFPKKPYNFETRNVLGENLNAPLLGMPAENDWVLRASYLDHTFIRNGLANYMSRETDRWASRTKHVELILNGEYQGIYLLMEDIKRDDNRLDIATLDSNEIAGEDVTGGYIWEITGFDEHFGERRKIKYPKINDVRPEQLQYIQSIDDAFRDKMRAPRPAYANVNTGYVAHINVESFIFEALIQEAMRNSDAYGWSGYYHKDKNDLIHAGPVWDFDQSSGNSSYPDNGVVEGWMIEHPSTSSTPFYWSLLLNDPFFKYSMKLRWEEKREEKFSDENLLGYIDSIANYLSVVQTREFTKWPVLGANIWRETNGFQERDTYQKEIDYLKEFLINRWSWIDGQLANVPKPAFYPEIKVPGEFSDTILDLKVGKYYFDLNEMFTYPFTSGLDFSAYSDDPSLIEVDINKENRLKLSLNEKGLCSIYIKAKDTYGNIKTTTFKVEIYNSDHVGIGDMFATNNRHLIVYPNPAEAIVTIKLADNQLMNGKLTLYNLTGQLVDERNLMMDKEIIYDAGKLQNGIYLLKVLTKDGQNYTSKLVIK